MNIYEFGIQQISERGVSPDNAKEIMDYVVRESNENPKCILHGMKDNWNSDTSEYSEQSLKIVVMRGIDDVALKYISKTWPKAWFLPMFDWRHPAQDETPKNT